MFKRILETVNAKRSYRRIFFYADGIQNPDGKIVLEDLYKHVKMFQSGIMDKDSLMYQAGQRDTVEHIIKMLKITDAEVTRHLEMEFVDNE